MYLFDVWLWLAALCGWLAALLTGLLAGLLAGLFLRLAVTLAAFAPTSASHCLGDAFIDSQH